MGSVPGGRLLSLGRKAARPLARKPAQEYAYWSRVAACCFSLGSRAVVLGVAGAAARTGESGGLRVLRRAVAVAGEPFCFCLVIG